MGKQRLLNWVTPEPEKNNHASKTKLVMQEIAVKRDPSFKRSLAIAHYSTATIDGWGCVGDGELEMVTEGVLTTERIHTDVAWIGDATWKATLLLAFMGLQG